ncbi:MAG: GNAT family N-acetyltransferase [Thaumarchaeota archaeon]|nr:GNAT family N-acetyltransferase [Nitrososphaerota archaeon]
MYYAKDGRKIVIRRVARKDLGSMANHWQSLADERRYIATEHVSPEQKAVWERSLSDPNMLWVRADIGGRLVGSLSLGRYGNLKKTRHIRNLGMGVVKEFREMGVGSALMDYAIKWADSKELKKVVLSVFSTNNAAIELYEKFGFVREGVRRKQFLIDGKFVDEVMMGRLL